MDETTPETADEAAERSRWWNPGDDADPKPRVAVLCSELLDGLKAVEHAAADDMARPILATILFTPSPDPGEMEAAVRLVAADNYRIATYDVEVCDGSPAALEGGLCVAVADVRALRALLKAIPKGAIVGLRRSADRLRFDWSAGGADFRLVDGQYPAYIQALAPPDMVPPTATVSVNPAFLADAGKAFGATPVLIEVRGELTPVRIVSEAHPRMTEVIMPVRTVRTTAAPARLNGQPVDPVTVKAPAEVVTQENLS